MVLPQEIEGCHEHKPIGDAAFEMTGQTYRIAAGKLRWPGLEKNGSSIQKGGTDDWLVSVTAEHELGGFTWMV